MYTIKPSSSFDATLEEVLQSAWNASQEYEKRLYREIEEALFKMKIMPRMYPEFIDDVHICHVDKVTIFYTIDDGEKFIELKWIKRQRDPFTPFK